MNNYFSRGAEKEAENIVEGKAKNVNNILCNINFFSILNAVNFICFNKLVNIEYVLQIMYLM